MEPETETETDTGTPNALDSGLDAIAWVCKLITGVALVVLTVIFGWLVFGRYVLNDTPTWVEQVSLLLVMLITFLGASVGIHEKSHLGVSYFREIVPVWMATGFSVVTDLALAGFGLVMAWYGHKLVLFKWGSQIPLIDLPEGLRAVPITICGGLVFLFSVGHLIRRARGQAPRVSVLE